MSKTPELFDTAFRSYRKTGILGEGACGVVFKVQDEANKEFALKCLRPECVDTEKRARFKNELDFCARTNHPNVLRVVDFGVVDWNGIKTPFYISERRARTLRGMMNAKIQPGSVLPIFDQLLSGVEAAHGVGVTHRDLKPENVLCGDDNKIVVGDFGIARFAEDQLATIVETKPHDKLANAIYAAPEQKKKGERVDHRADIFALGLILNEMFTGDVLHGTGYRTIESVAPNFSYLDEIVASMVRQSPAERPQSIDEIKLTLRARGNEFVSRQQLDEARSQVVPDAEAPVFRPIRRIDSDWRNGKLIFKFDRLPPDGWKSVFRNPEGSYKAVLGAGPSDFELMSDYASVKADDEAIEQIVSHFDDYVAMANDTFLRKLREVIKRQRDQEEEAVRLRIAQEEKRQRILGILRPK